MKRIIITFITIICFLVGCAKNNTTNKNVNSSIIHMPNDNGINSDKKNILDEIKKKYPDKVVLTVVSKNYVDDEVVSELNEILNATSKPYVVYFDSIKEREFGEYKEIVNQRIESNDCIDLLCSGVGDVNGTTINAYQNEWLLELDDYLQNDGQEIMSAIDSSVLAACKINGHYYGFSTYTPFTDSFCYFVNTDIMKKYGIAIDDIKCCKPDELREILSKVSGEKDCTLFSRGWDDAEKDLYNGAMVFQYYGAARTPAISVLSDGSDSIVNIYENEGFINYIKAISEYRKLGYMDESENFFIIESDMLCYDENAKNEAIKRIKNKYTKAGNIEAISYATMPLQSHFIGIMGVCKNTQNEKYAKDFLKEVFTNPDVSNLMTYGVKESYVLENDRVVYIDQNMGSSNEWNSSLSWGNIFINHLDSEEPENKKQVIGNALSKMPKTIQLGLYIDMSKHKDKIDKIVDIVKEYDGMYDGMYENVDETIGELNQRLKDAGIDYIIDDLKTKVKSVIEE